MMNATRIPTASALVIATLVVLGGCGGAPPADAPAEVSGPAVDPDLAPGEHVWNTPDGNRMPYTVTGEGEVTVLLVHCWMCDRSFWANQVPLLAEQYRTIAVDLPGHGAASSDRAAWRVATYGDDVAGFVNDLDLRDVILVGHSMGGPVSLRAAAQAHGRVRGIVAVDTLHDAEFVFAGPQVDGYLAAFQADYVGTCEGMVAQMFPEENVDDVAVHVRAAGCDPGRAAIGTALLRDFASIEMSRWFAEAGVPIRAINAAAPNPTQIETNRKYADYDAQLIEGVGHYPHMTRPDTFNPLMLQAIAEILAIGG